MTPWERGFWGRVHKWLLRRKSFDLMKYVYRDVGRFFKSDSKNNFKHKCKYERFYMEYKKF